MPSRLTDEVWLREQVAAYRTAREIADELGVTDRAVRYALRRYDIERPPRQELIDVALAEYRAGTTLATIAAKVHRSKSWIRKVVQQAGAEQPAGFRQRRPPKYPQLHHVDWMRAQLDAGGSVRSIATDVGTDRHTVRKAMARHGSTGGPSSLHSGSSTPWRSKKRPDDARCVSSTSCSVVGPAWPRWPIPSASRRQRCGRCVHNPGSERRHSDR